MNSYQKARLDASKAVIKEAKNKPTTVNKIPNFKKGIDRLEEITNELEILSVEQGTDITGITDNKGDVQGNLSDTTVDVAGAVYTYAMSINDKDLMAKVNFTPGLIPDMNGGDLIIAAEVVLAEAKKVAPLLLADNGISAEDLTEMETLITLYKEVKPAPRVARVDHASATERIRLLFLEMTQLFRGTLDRLAVQFKKKDLDFYLKYRAARNIVHKGPSSTPPSTSTTPSA